MIKAPNRHNTNAKRKSGGCQVFIAERKAKRVKRVNFLSATYYDHVSSGAISDHHHKFGQIKTIWIFNFSYRPEPSIYACLTVERTPREKRAYCHRPDEITLKSSSFTHRYFKCFVNKKTLPNLEREENISTAWKQCINRKNEKRKKIGV